MSDQKRVKIRYKPRDQFRPFHSRKQRWSVLVCHRRAGKTVATLNDLIRGAVNEFKHEGRYAFIFPQRNQAKDTAWRYLRRRSTRKSDSLGGLCQQRLWIRGSMGTRSAILVDLDRSNEHSNSCSALTIGEHRSDDLVPD